MTRSKLWQASVLLFLLTTVPAFGQSRGAEHWVGTWSNAVVALPMPPPQPAAPPAGAQVAAAGRGAAGDAGRAGRGGAGGGRGRLALNNQTLRQIVHTSIGGDHLRVVLTNAFGSEPLIVDAAFVALHVKDGTIGTGGKPLVFAGRPSITIPAGAVVVSDAVDLKLAPFSDLAIDLHVPGDLTGGNSAITMHGTGLQTNYLSAAGNVVGATEFAGATTSQSVYLVSRVEVLAPPQTMAIAAFGDSITDGTRSTPNTNHRWPDVLARRLEKQSPGRFAVLNAAIAGNRLLAEANGQFGINALARFDRDVLVQPGVTHVIVMEGINDIGMARDPSTPTALDIIAAQKQLIERAHAKGLKVIGATLTPFEGAAYFTPEGEAKRKAVNDWIRTSKAYDSVIDFDAVVRDASQPTKFQAAFDSGDHLHPNDAGYEAMGNAVDLKIFAASR